MKTRFDKSKIIKFAHHMRKYEGSDMSTALTLVWDKPRRSDFYLIVEVSKPKNVKIGYSNTVMQQSLIDFYSRSDAYCGD